MRPQANNEQKNYKGHVLVADDQPSMRRLLQRILQDDGYDVVEAPGGKQALEAAKKTQFHVVVTDLAMPDMDGIELLSKIKEFSPQTAVVLITAYGSVQSAVEAMKLGAFDYLTKPLAEPEELRVIVANAMKQRRLENENEALRSHDEWDLIYEHGSMVKIVRTIERIAPTDATVLVTGESGTGKELVARRIHDLSNRRERPFVAVNCAALSETLLESELFGHEKGSFTGADKQRRGRFEVADGGTLFLDEVGEMSPALQAKLLRVMQERSFERVGSTTTITVDVRILAATNRNLLEEIAAGRFREDLYYRLNVVPIDIPALRDRGGDSVLLAEHLLRKNATSHGLPVPALTDDAKRAVAEYHWPGNVRELSNVVERAVLLSQGDVDAHVLGLSPGAPKSTGQIPLNLKALEKEAIIRALDQTEGNRRKAAEILGIGLRTLHYKLNEYDLRKYLT